MSIRTPYNSGTLEPTHRYATRKIRKYQNSWMNCNNKIGRKIWYFIHQTIQTPSEGAHRFAASLKWAVNKGIFVR